MKTITQHITAALEKGKKFAVATILANHGSTPGTPGNKMLVFEDLTIEGTIGGGLVESLVIDESVRLIRRQACRIKEFTLDHDMKDGLDMICGGALNVLIETFDSPLAEYEIIFKRIEELERKGEKGFLVSRISGISRSEFSLSKCAATPDGKVTGTNMLPPALLKKILENRFQGSAPVLHNENLEEYIIETIQPKECIFIFGAGHVGLQLAKAAHIADFNTVVIDDRKEFANQERFPNALKVIAVDHFSHAFARLRDEGFEIDRNSYIVILTRGHLHDQIVLDAALQTAPAYTGMIGSRTKRDKIYRNLLKKGVSQDLLDSVYSPIGLDIKARTPGEIAVSIMGEIIEKRYS